MNALVSVDIETLTPATVFAPGGIDAIVSKIEAEVRAEAFDVTTLQGRDRIKSVAYKVARSKTALDDMGKELVADIKKQAGAIDADRRTARDRLDALKDEVRAPLTAWEQAEEQRIGEHTRALTSLVEATRFAATVPSANCIEQRIAEVRETCRRMWEEFHEQAEAAATAALASLEAMHAAAEQRERDQAELDALRKEKAERDEQDRANAEAKARAEAERIRTEQQAERERLHAEQRERDQAAAEERAKRQAEEAAARAVEAERRRVANEEAAAADRERLRQQNKRHRERIHSRIKGALIQWELGDEQANDLIGKIAAGEIPHLSITY